MQGDSISDQIIVFGNSVIALLINYDTITHWADVAICAVIGTAFSYAVKEILKRKWSSWFPKKSDNDKWNSPNRRK